MADPLQSAPGMVVPLILLGAATKLAFAVALTYRTRTWWLPGGYAIGLGALGCLHEGATRTLGAASVVLGVAALVAARQLAVRRAVTG